MPYPILCHQLFTLLAIRNAYTRLVLPAKSILRMKVQTTWQFKMEE
jgi:hypothetical protein